MQKFDKDNIKETDKDKMNGKDMGDGIGQKYRRNMYYIYGFVFVFMLVLLICISIRSNADLVNANNANRKNNLNLANFDKTLLETVNNAENNTDIQMSAKVKEVSGDNVKDNKEDSKKEDIENEEKDNEDTDKDTKKVYLTFDDGPSPVTDKILSILKKYDAKATFFVCYHKGEKNKQLYKRIVDEGHTIAVHSYTHNYKVMYSSEKAFINDVRKMRNYIKDVTGVETNIYRFPGGSGNKVSKVSIKKCIKILKKESMIYFDWNVENGDATGKKLSDKQLINNVVKNVKTKNTPIVLMHDSAAKTSTAKTLPKIIDILKKQGYEFVAINEDTPRIQQRK